MTADFEALVRQNSGRLRRIALRYADGGDHEDLLQDILLALWRSYPSFRGDARTETWVYRVALNTALSDVRRKISRRGVAQTFRGMFREASAPAGRAEKDILSEFLDSLNEVDASVMMMTLDGMTPKEIEEVIGTSANAISVRINRIKQKYMDTYVE